MPAWHLPQWKPALKESNMRKFFVPAAIAAVALFAWACGHTSGPTTSTTIPEQTTASAPSAPASADPKTVEPTPAPGSGWASTFYANTGWKITNLSGIGQAYRAYITSFDDQVTEIAFAESGTVPNGKDFVGSFNRGCDQLDITQEGKSGRPFTYAYFDKDGKEFDPGAHPEKVTECRTPTCVEPREHREIPGEYSWNSTILEGKCEVETLPIGVDTWTPNNCHQVGTQDITVDLICSNDTKSVRSLCRNIACPTPPPCEPTFTKETSTSYSEWGACSILEGKSQQSRVKTVDVATTNSCTKAVTHEITKTTEWQRCTLPFCHVAADGAPSNAEDFDVTIQTTQFQYQYPEGNPGHNAHLVPTPSNDHATGFCPQDFWGVCSSQAAKAEILGISSYFTGSHKHYFYFCSATQGQ